MSEHDNTIIVYTTYSTSLQATLAKVTLDSHGIPCFLSDENMGILLSSGIRLHIFLRDKSKVKEALSHSLSD